MTPTPPATPTPDWLARRARTDREAPALTFRGRAWSFGDLDRAAARSASALAAAGIEPGARVALLARNGSGWAIAAHAVARAGATLVPLNVRLTVPELSWQLADAGPPVLLHDGACEATARLLVAERGTVLLGIDDEGVASGAGGIAAASGLTAPDGVQAVVYTSGTTGRPKGARIAFANWWAGAAAAALHLGHRRDDRWLAALPLFHVGGLAILFRSAIGGVPVTLLDGFDPEEAVAAVARDRVTLVSLVAATLDRLVAAQPTPGALSSLRVALLGGGPAPAGLVAEATARGIPVAPTYGLTEAASQVATLPPGLAAALPGCAGPALPHMEIRIERDGAAIGDGDDGEIAIRGAGLMRGYLGADPLPPGGWFRTGDIGRLDTAGRLYVLDRRDDLIVSGGENVYPAEVEAALLRHPAVAEAAVVGVPDARWGSAPAAFVVLRHGSVATPEEIRGVASQVLAPFKRPRAVIVVDELPRNASGKLLRRALRDRLTAEATAEPLPS